MLPWGPITFRAMEDRDIPLLLQWLRKPHVAEFWDSPLFTDEELDAKYKGYLASSSRVRPFIGLVSGQPFAYMQCYIFTSEDVKIVALGYESSAFGMDYLIGDERHVGRGLAPSLLRSFLQLVAFPLYTTFDRCVIDPASNNMRSRRVAEKAGFVLLEDEAEQDSAEATLSTVQDVNPVLYSIRRSQLLTAKGASVGQYPSGYPVVVRELWTSRQRQMSRLHEVSYRACFKAELPDWFIERYTQEGDIVYDPFAGRGTTALQASLRGRRFISNDLNPLSRILTEPRITPPPLSAIAQRLDEIDFNDPAGLHPSEDEPDLQPFYNPQTLAELRCLRSYLYQRRISGQEDILDAWIRMVATTRLTGHSPGYFSVYTLPPNQAVSPKRQRVINERYQNDLGVYRSVRNLIWKKTQKLLRDCPQGNIGLGGLFLTCDATETYAIPDHSVQLIVTSPPFLNVVQYESDNWLRLWFNCLQPELFAGKMIQTGKIGSWNESMLAVFREFKRVMAPGAYGAFEVGEVQSGRVKLDEEVYRLLIEADLLPEATLINQQVFTKTANIWGVNNNSKGTNSNRIVLFRQGM